MGIAVHEHNLIQTDTLGEGGYGELFEATSVQNSDEVYAVKRNIPETEFAGSLGTLVELDFLQRVKEHPHCVTLEWLSVENPFVNIEPDNSYISFVLEKGDCDSASFFIDDDYPDRCCDAELVRQFLCESLLGLEYLHSRNIMHLDIKPANIICKLNDGKLETTKIIDFGLSQDLCKICPVQSNVVTIWYRSPEVVLNLDYNHNADIWSMGCVLYEILKGTPLFRKCNSEDKLINTLYSKFEFPFEYKHVMDSVVEERRGRKKILPLKDHLSLSKAAIKQFNEGDNRNFKNCLDLLEYMLTVDASERPSATKCLDHPFFETMSSYIQSTRVKFGINNEGVWMTNPVSVFSCTQSTIRDSCMKHFEMVFNERMKKPISRWYSHRILFHAIEMCDRFLTLGTPKTASASDVVIWVNSFLFMSAKYFRVMVESYPTSQFAIGISEDQHELFKEHANAFERRVVIELFRGEVYKETLYDLSEEILSHMQIAGLLKLVFSGQQINGVTLTRILNSTRRRLYNLNLLKKMHKLKGKSCIGPMNKKWTTDFV